jgi:hypothetical protein
MGILYDDVLLIAGLLSLSVKVMKQEEQDG